MALGIASSLRWISTGGPFMWGNGWWGQVLNVEELKYVSNHFSIRALFSGVHSNGSSFGASGTIVRGGQKHMLSGPIERIVQPAFKIRLLGFWSGIEVAEGVEVIHCGVADAPTVGKSFEIVEGPS